MTYTWGRRLVASALSALVVAAVAYVGSIIAVFISQGFQTTILAQASGFYDTSAIAAVVLLFAAGLLGGYSRGWVAVIVGIVVGALSALVGGTLLVTFSGGALTGAILAQLLMTLFGFNLLLWILIAVGTPTLGRRLYRVLLDSRLGTEAGYRIALVRMPSSNLAEGLVTHIERAEIDTELADSQWDGYVAALTEAGWTTIEVAPANDLADAVFVEDTAVVFGDIAVIARPGAESRSAETAGTEVTLRNQGLQIERIEEPGTLDGGDVLTVGSTVYVGRGGRTNADGIRQLRALLAPLGYTVIAVPVTKALHLKTAVTALPDGTVIGYPPLLDDTSLFPHFLAVPEAEGAAVVVLDDNTVLMSSSAPGSAELIAGLGYRVITTDLSEFEKLEGCVTCLSIRIP
ncbi:MAG: dimethylargininase [Microbacteriaceae bacterium]|jgi:dimethylargininase|nr:dimethylargininase [Microbacteriaceae bacterium]